MELFSFTFFTLPMLLILGKVQEVPMELFSFTFCGLQMSYSETEINKLNSNMTEDFSLKALVLGTIRLGIKAKGRLLLGYKVGVSLD